MPWGTRATTEVQIPRDRFKVTNLGINTSVKARFFREYVLHRLRICRVDLSDVTLDNYVAMYYQRLASMDDERLPAGKEWFPQYITGPSVEEEIRNRSKELLTHAIVGNPMLPGGSPRAMVTKIVADLLCRRRSEIHSVVNIGAFVDTQCAYLAPRYTEISFLSVDRYGDINRLNAFLPQSPNWTFRAGYPLDMLADGSLSADLFFMTSTSVCCPHRELAAYIKLFAKRCKFLVFNEPWWPSLTSLNLFKIPRPEEINPNRPLIGLAYFNFQNNYIFFLEKHGFKVKTSRIVPTAGGSLWYTLQIVAENSALGATTN